VGSSGSTLTGRKRRALLYLQEEQWNISLGQENQFVQ
jgi:hypothetical protein